MSREAMKHIKTWNERCEEHPDHQERIISERMIQERMQEEIDELRQALETEQKPVAWASGLDFDDDQEIIPAKDKGKLGTSNCDIPLYTEPKRWVGLTDGEIDILSCEMVKGDKSVNWLCKVLEAKLREKNA
jgi:hypothetical protein